MAEPGGVERPFICRFEETKAPHVPEANPAPAKLARESSDETRLTRPEAVHAPNVGTHRNAVCFTTGCTKRLFYVKREAAQIVGRLKVRAKGRAPILIY